MKLKGILFSAVAASFGFSTFTFTTIAAGEVRAAAPAPQNNQGGTNSPLTRAQLQAQEASPTRRETMAQREQVKVWVDPHTKLYYLPGERWYGKTKQGKFMTEQQAIAKGYQETKQSAEK